MIKSIKTKILLSISPLVITSCATVFSGSTQNINIKVIDSNSHQELVNTSCMITDGEGSNYSMTANPSVISVNRGSGKLTVLCKSPGYKQLNVVVGDSFNAATIGNLIFWPGFVIDGVSGAYKKYPSHYVVLMEASNRY